MIVCVPRLLWSVTVSQPYLVFLGFGHSWGLLGLIWLNLGLSGIFLMIRLALVGFGKEPHRGEVSFLSHHIRWT